eukprot:TRINITY_DN31610_c0_g2_i1.p1 TRINITY_DN31610_c0_g2~~TRINITY_DN31610_c0_g2_i1.p1  ORF type:complete len:765 (+),score=152.40 TRINITY_DN31610_c0_g2_i1:161-2455(+)
MPVLLTGEVPTPRSNLGEAASSCASEYPPPPQQPDLRPLSADQRSPPRSGGAGVSVPQLREELTKLKNELLFDLRRELRSGWPAPDTPTQPNLGMVVSEGFATDLLTSSQGLGAFMKGSRQPSHSGSCSSRGGDADVDTLKSHQWATRHIRSHIARQEIRQAEMEMKASQPSILRVTSHSDEMRAVETEMQAPKGTPDRITKASSVSSESKESNLRKRLSRRVPGARAVVDEIIREEGNARKCQEQNGKTSQISSETAVESIVQTATKSAGSAPDPGPPVQQQASSLRTQDSKKLDMVSATSDNITALDYSMGLVGGQSEAHLLPWDASQTRRRLDAMLRRPAFEALTLICITANALVIGFETNIQAKDEETSTFKMIFRGFDILFCIVFTAELLLRGYTYRCNFFRMVGWAWNVFDLVVVMLQLSEEFVLLVVDEEANSHNGIILRVARVLRAVRIMRVFRMVRFARDLRLLVCCIITAGKAFFWVCVLLFMMTFVMGVYIVQVIQQYRTELAEAEYEELQVWFGTVPRAMLSLFEALTGGVDWDALCRPLMTTISYLLGYFYCAYMAFSVLAVLNIVTGTFVEAAIDRASEVKLVDRVYQARRLFQTLDLDKNGSISFSEVTAHMNDIDKTELREYFESIDVDISEAGCLFEILDIDDSGTIDLEEFISGCLRMQGPAKALDLLLITRESSRSMDRTEKVLASLQAQVSHIGQNVEALWPRSAHPIAAAGQHPANHAAEGYGEELSFERPPSINILPPGHTG